MPYLLRRVKSDVKLQLPKKSEQVRLKPVATLLHFTVVLVLGVQLLLAYEHLARGHKNMMVSVGLSRFRFYFESLFFIPGSVLSAHKLPA